MPRHIDKHVLTIINSELDKPWFVHSPKFQNLPYTTNYSSQPKALAFTTTVENVSISSTIFFTSSAVGSGSFTL